MIANVARLRVARLRVARLRVARLRVARLRVARPEVASLGAARLMRYGAAVQIAIGGYIHYRLWVGGYRAIPNIGRLFVVNVAVSAAVALALVVTGRWPVAVAASSLAAAGLAAGSLAALLASRSFGFLGFSEGWTVDAQAVLASEIGALVALGAAVVAPRALGKGALAGTAGTDPHRPAPAHPGRLWV